MLDMFEQRGFNNHNGKVMVETNQSRSTYTQLQLQGHRLRFCSSIMYHYIGRDATKNLTVPDARALEEFWASCQVCKQPYQNELALSLARGFVSYADNLLSNALIDDTEVEELANSLVRRRDETLEERINLIVRICKNNDGIKLESYKMLLRKNESTSAESKEVLDKMLSTSFRK